MRASAAALSKAKRASSTPIGILPSLAAATVSLLNLSNNAGVIGASSSQPLRRGAIRTADNRSAAACALKPSPSLSSAASCSANAPCVTASPGSVSVAGAGVSVTGIGVSVAGAPVTGGGVAVADIGVSDTAASVSSRYGRSSIICARTPLGILWGSLVTFLTPALSVQMYMVE